ncbi:MAG: hypothetical protein H0Z24_03545 [Thermosipho sp. (in: Bacteria)]|nr:hypothetical protein [Thermosipho sp. (in: thermotogales)]
MKDILLKLKKDEKGAVILWVLLLIPVLYLATTYTVIQVQVITGADVDLQGGLNSAVKAAAAQVTDDSQADGNPRINTNIAHLAFRQELARNLGLDQTTLTPLTGSLLAEAPNYILIVYNGDDAFASGGALDARIFEFKNGFLTATDFVGTGFPFTFGVDNNNIYLSATGIKQVTLDQPGVIALVTVKQKKIVGSDNPNIQISRWACAKIVY